MQEKRGQLLFHFQKSHSSFKENKLAFEKKVITSATSTALAKNISRQKNILLLFCKYLDLQKEFPDKKNRTAYEVHLFYKDAIT